MQRKTRFGALLGTAGLLAGLALTAAGAPAMAASACSSSPCNGSVSASVTVPTSFTFTLTSTSINFGTLSAGSGNTSAQPVNYSVQTNDASGYTVSAWALSNFTGTHPGDTMTIGGASPDIALWGQMQYSGSSGMNSGAPVNGSYYVAPLGVGTTNAVTTANVSCASGAWTLQTLSSQCNTAPQPGQPDQWTDSYAFLSGSWTNPLNQPTTYTGVPAVPPDTYTTTIDYLATAK